MLAGLDPAHLKTFLPQIVGVTATLHDRWGKAAEGIGSQLMEDAARVIVQLDDQAAAALGEPVILPPPVKTPPPPPDPKESWWTKLLRKK